MPVSIDHLLTAAKSALLANAPERAMMPLLTLLATDPDHMTGLLLRGRAELELKDYPRATATLTQLTKAHPDYAEGWVSLAAALRKLDRLEDAEVALLKAIELSPNHAGAQNNLGNLYGDMDRLDAARQAYEQALRASPDFASAQRSLITVLRDLGELEAAIEQYQQLETQTPEAATADARFSHALSLLSAGHFQKGWDYYEARFQIPELDITHIPGTRWSGNAALDGVLVIHAEQGFGDIIQFSRYLPLAKQAWRGKLVFVVQKQLKELMQLLPVKPDQILTDGQELPPYHRHCPLLSLPNLFGTPGTETAPTALPTPPYFTVPLALRHRVSAILPPKQQNKQRIGLVWRGRPSHANDAHRSIPLPEFAPLLSQANIDWIGLTPDPIAEDAPALANIFDVAPALSDFAITSAVIQELDAVVTVDSAVAHLAGALNKPAHVLIPNRPDFRWERNRTDSRWYPSLTLYRRQHTQTSWSHQIDQVLQALTPSTTSQTCP